MRERARDGLRTAALVTVCAVCIGAVRGTAAEVHQRVKETSEVYVLPPPEHVAVLSLGYRAALADLLWAHVLVSQGFRMQERRRFENLTLLLDSINTLDPTFRDPYLYADALITLQTVAVPREEVLKAREILERGVANRPLDAEMWLVAGQFISFVAPSSYLRDEEEKKAWRLDGARMLARAAELGGGDTQISWQAIGGAGVLERAGERDAAIRFLERTLAVTDDDELKKHILEQLGALLADKHAEAYMRRQGELKALWSKDLPFVSTTMFLVLGPPFDAAYCAGGEHAEEPRCATTWKSWQDRLEATQSR